MKILPLAGLAALVLAVPALAGDMHSILQRDQAFSSPTLTIGVGDTVMWGNADDVTHNISIVEPNGTADDMGLQKKNEIIKHTFDAAGTYKVMCKIHPKMKMSVTVH